MTSRGIRICARIVSATALPVVACLVGLGVFDASGFDANPTDFAIKHPNIVDLNGVHRFQVTFQSKVQYSDADGGTYTSFENAGYGNVVLMVDRQKGGTFVVRHMSLYAYGTYGGGLPTDHDSLAPSKINVLGRIRVARTRQGYSHQVYENTEVSTRFKLRRGDVVSLAASYGEGGFALHPGRSSVSGRVPRTSFKLGTAALAGDIQMEGKQSLEVLAEWASDTSGLVSFAAPSFLKGKSGTITKLADGRYLVRGPVGSRVRLLVSSDGSGAVDLGYGSFRVDAGAFQIQ